MKLIRDSADRRLSSLRRNRVTVFFLAIVLFSVSSCLAMIFLAHPGNDTISFSPNDFAKGASLLDPPKSVEEQKRIPRKLLKSEDEEVGNASKQKVHNSSVDETNGVGMLRQNKVVKKSIVANIDKGGGGDDDKEDATTSTHDNKARNKSIVANSDKDEGGGSGDADDDKEDETTSNDKKDDDDIEDETTSNDKKDDDDIEDETMPMYRTRARPRQTIPAVSGKLPQAWLNAVVNSRTVPDADQFPPDFNIDFTTNPYPKNILRKEIFQQTSLRKNRKLKKDDAVPHLGVLLDAGRHYFPVDWIKRMIDVVSVMNFNTLHFRLTDDQTFNVQLESQPLLAYPSTLNNNTKVYTPKELKAIVKHAKSKGIKVIPEINVPGHAGAWGGVPGLIVQCPNFICSKGYGIPLNVSHPQLRPILTDVLREVIDIFDNPPFLHLGGDEVNMARPCFDEIGERMFDYNDFERMLSSILSELKYNESQVIRWEMSQVLKHLKRAGDITQFWFRIPGTREFQQNYGQNFSSPMFLSAGLYFDTNEEDHAFDVYVKTKKLKHNHQTQSPILGIIAGTFELSTEFWHDRNVIGRLLAVSIGASKTTIRKPSEFFGHYGRVCKSIGFDDSICRLYGVPPKRYQDHRHELKDPSNPEAAWSKWIDNTCDRFTYPAKKRVCRASGQTNYRAMEIAQSRFWRSFAQENPWGDLLLKNSTAGSGEQQINLNGKRLVDHTGVMMDLARYMVDDVSTLGKIALDAMNPLGLNTIQLRLVTDVSFAYVSRVHPALQWEPKTLPEIKKPFHPTLANLMNFKRSIRKAGIGIFPEIAISTNAGGMYDSAFNVLCPEFSCKHWEYIPQDIEDIAYPRLVYSLLQELSQLSSTPYMHLGHDQREMSTPCFLEMPNRKLPNFDYFERKMDTLLPLTNITGARVIRWENKEKIHYPGRFGDITQCHARDGGCSRLIAATNPTPWFGTIDIRQGGPYDIYSTTRELAAHSPIGLIAEIGRMTEDSYERSLMNYRMLAFSMGSLDLPVMLKDEFDKLYVQTCLNLSFSGEKKSSKGMHNQKNSTLLGERHESICRSFVTAKRDSLYMYTPVQKEAARLKSLAKDICASRTHVINVHEMKDPSKIETAVSLQTA